MSDERVPGGSAGRVSRGLSGLLLVLGLLLWAPWARAQDDANDPIEPFNRAVFAFNDVVDGLIIEPASELYGLVVPSPVRTGVRNFLDNLRAPVVFANDVLQGERERAGVTLGRFMINTILGGFGIFDVAQHFGYEKDGQRVAYVRHGEDFGQTLAVWGVGEGFYLVLPILGPSTARDALGLAVDTFVINPSVHVTTPDERIVLRVTDGIDTRHQLDSVIEDLRRNSIDRYATFRTVYRQRRAAEIRNGRAPVDDESYDDIFNIDPESDDATPSLTPR